MGEIDKNPKIRKAAGEAIILGGHYGALAGFLRTPKSRHWDLADCQTWQLLAVFYFVSAWIWQSNRAIEAPFFLSDKLLAAAKGLSQKGVRVALLVSSPHEHASNSIFVSQLILGPDPEVDSDKLVNILMDLEKNWDGRLLVPALDEYVMFVSQNSVRLKDRFVFAVQDWGLISRIIHKNFLYIEPQKADIPTPRFFLPDFIDALKKWQDKFMDAQINNLDVTISELIPGDDTSIFSYRCYIDSQGEVLAEMCTKRVRQYPPRFGQGAVQRTVPMIPEICCLGLKLLRSLSYREEATVEFRLDCRDNEYRLMEIYVTPAAAAWFLIKAGMNFLYITYLDLVKNTRQILQNYDHELCRIHNHWEVVNPSDFWMTHKLNLRKFLRFRSLMIQSIS